MANSTDKYTVKVCIMMIIRTSKRDEHLIKCATCLPCGHMRSSVMHLVALIVYVCMPTKAVIISSLKNYCYYYCFKMVCNKYYSCISYTCMYLASLVPRVWLVACYKLHMNSQNELSQVKSMIYSAKKWKRNYQPIIFSKWYPDVRVLKVGSLSIQCKHQNLPMHSQSVLGHQNS